MGDPPNLEYIIKFIALFIEGTILVAEDEGLIALHVTEILEEAGYTILDVVSSGEVVLKRLETANEPDLILMDVDLAGSLDGIETAMQIRKKYTIPLILVTAYSHEHTLEQKKGIKALWSSLQTIPK